MSYRESNDNWKQMLIILDEMGDRAFFIHLLVTRSSESIQELRSGQWFACKSLRNLFFAAMADCAKNIEDSERLLTIHYKL